MQSTPTQGIKAQGQVLGLSGNGGLILGDDGARYTFMSSDWRDFTSAPASGMRVEFSATAPYATEILVLEMPPQYAAPETGAAPGYSGQQEYGGSNAGPGYGAVGGQQTVGGSHGSSSAYQKTVPLTQYRQVSKFVVGLIYIFLGPISRTVEAFYVGHRHKLFILFFNILLIPLFVVAWPLIPVVWALSAIGGIWRLFYSDEKFNLKVHIARFHPIKWSLRDHPDNCHERRPSVHYVPLCRQASLKAYKNQQHSERIRQTEHSRSEW